MSSVRTPTLRRLVLMALRISAAGVLALGISALAVTAASAQPKTHPIPRGYEWLYNFHSGKCAYIVNGSDHNGAKLEQGTCENRREYGFLPKVGFAGSDVYFFQDSVNLPSASHHFLCVSVANDRGGSTLIQEPCNYQNPPSKQRFRFHMAPFYHGYQWYSIESVASGFCVNITNASTANGALVQQHQCSTVHHQSSWFIFVKPGVRLPCPCTTVVTSAARQSGKA
jgi:hypothetical protein